MRRSMSQTEPKIARAGEVGTWKFIYTPSQDLPKGTRCKFDMRSKGGDSDWEIPQIDRKKGRNLIWMSTEDGKPIRAKTVTASPSQFAFTLPQKVLGGSPITIVMGAPKEGTEEKKGNRAQHQTQWRRPFSLSIDTEKKGEYKDVATFQLNVRGNTLQTIRSIVPSIVNKNQRFDLIVRFEDIYGNLTGHAPEGTLIALSHDKLRKNIDWKLFVPETGLLSLPNFYFNERGIYRFQLKNLQTEEIFYSPPMQCLDESLNRLHWGSFHEDLGDSAEDIEFLLHNIQEKKGWDFFSSSPFASEKETPTETWKTLSNQIANFYDDNRFTIFLGMQWVGEPSAEGIRQIIYLKENKPPLRKKEGKTQNLKKIYKSHPPKEVLSIPSMTMSSTHSFNFKKFAPEYERVIEIYNAWGSSECTKKEGNPRPIYAKTKKGMQEKGEGAIRKALNENHRFGFVAGGCDERGIFSKLIAAGQKLYSPGVTAIFSTNHAKESIVQALNQRASFATTGPHILLNFHIAQQPMGQELNTSEKPGLRYNRHISGLVAGTAPIKEILVIRNGEIFYTCQSGEEDCTFTLDDSDPIEKIALKGGGKRPPFIYYYMRIEQEDGHLAWSSPIWIDQIIPKKS